MSPRSIATALLCLAACAAHGQAALNLQRAAPQVKSDAELAKLKTAPQAELQRLQNERKQVCEVKPNAAECDKKTRALNAAKPALEGKIQALGKHEVDARAGRLQKLVPGRAAVLVPPGNNSCKSCHAAPGSVPASDPTTAVPGGKPAAQPTLEAARPRVDPERPAGATDNTRYPINVAPSNTSAGDPPGPVPGAGGSRVTPPASATGCFIATAAYGSGDAEQVQLLRRFRDEKLIGHPAGDLFVQTYYRISPPIAEFIADRPWMRATVRGLLQPVVLAVREPETALAALGLMLMAAMLALQRRSLRRVH